MPYYDYMCDSCGERFEIFQSMLEKNKPCCPTCSGNVVRQLIGNSGVIFKGSGFYVTDSRTTSSDN